MPEPVGNGQPGANQPNPNTPAGDGNTPAPKAWHEEHVSDPNLRGSESLKKFKTVEALAGSYVNLERTFGSRVAIPGKDAKPEDVTKFHRAMGVPETPDKYLAEGSG